MDGIKGLQFPTPEQVQALVDFSDRNGGNWKSALNSLWTHGRDVNEAEGPLLRQIRNIGGPSWLHRFNLNGRLFNYRGADIRREDIGCGHKVFIAGVAATEIIADTIAGMIRLIDEAHAHPQ